jgi:uncharacterized membrane protein
MSFAFPIAAYLAGVLSAAALVVLAVWELQRIVLGN